ncbi:MAG: T9SS type A sorting domain-containing protein, partial [Flavobacteriales bacterium]|nr:T9SS type A sorting domain-containing protein [Flavobacteriales bacterium]
ININGGGWNVLQTLAATGLDPWTFTNFPLTGTDNAASVQIRFHYDDGGIFATGLAIDDVLIYEPPPYDAVITDVNSEYTQIPEKHASPLVLETTVDNQGENTVTNVQMTVNVVNENLLPLFTGTSNTIGSLAINTTGTLTVPGGYAPIDTGWHRREYIVSILENDGKRSNDTAYSWVYVSDSVYSRDDGVVTSGLGVGAGSFAILGETFELQTSDYLTNIMSFSFGHAVGDTTRLVVWDMGVTFPNAEVAATAEYIFVPADTPSTTFILPILGGPVLLSAGTYFIGIEDYMSTDNVGVGTTDDIYTPGGTFGQINFGAWDSLENLGGFTLALVLRPMFAPCNVVLTVSTTNSTCGACDGTTTVTATAGTGPYNYLWDDPLAQTNATATALCPASYTVLVTDANGCTETSGITVTDGASMTISITTIDEGCGNANGTATVTASGGTGAYTYTWSNAQTTSTAVGLVAGTYNVTVEDNAGCSVETDFFSAANIGNIPPPTANADLDGSVCADAGYLLNGSIGSSATSSTWSSSGTGTFDDATLLTATYTPSPADTTAGSVTLTLTTNDPDGGGPCVAVADAMILTIVSAATVSAGANDAICEGSTYTLAGIRGGVASTSTWITSGTGSFSNASLVNAVYTPSAADITAGTATLTITTNDPAGICGPATDLMVLTINAAATANAGVDATICEGNTYTLSGSLGGSASSSNWGTSGSGGFNNTTLLAAVYTPSAGDITAGTVNLILTTDDPDGAGPCLAGTDLMVLTISTAATANAGANASICEGDTYALSGAIGGSATSSTWTTSGSGLFNNASLLAAVYTPSAGDIVVGSVTLSLTTNDPAGPCIATVDPMVLTIDQAATATAGADATICGGDTYVVSGTRGGGATSSTWTTSGSGSFTNASLLSTIYTPSAGDITAGTVNLIITTDDPAGPCIIATDLLTLTINPAATASAGADATICEGSTYLLAGARGGSASSSTWTTSGTGSFDLATLLAATYTPSAADITAGSVTLTITTDDPAGPCLSAIDNMVLTIDLIPTASAGADVTICEGDNVTLAGLQGGGASSIAWTSSGTGTFNNNALLAAIYTASAADITAGSVTLTITTDNPAGPCNAASDIMVLTINPAATVNAGIDATICDGVVYPLSGAIGGSASSSTWASSGSGAFDNVTLLNATYTPSAGDVVAGSVSLTLTSNDPAGPCTSTADFMVLTLNAKDDPAFAYSSGTFCQTSTDPTPTISGTPGGTFSEVSANIVFISTSTGEIDVSASILGGPYTIQYVTSGTCPDSSTVNITITTSPDATFTFASPYCQGDPNPLPTFGGGASAGIFSATPGGMVFANASTGEIDLGASSAGSYTVENLIVASGGCGADTATFSVTVDLMATAAAGADATICETDAYTLSGSRGGSATSSTWISSGTGTFDDATLVAATYTPSAADILAGNVTLTITTDNPIGPCTAATDNMVLIINLAATTVAGANDTICEGDVKTLSGSIGGSASSVIWSSSGTGNFNNATLLAPTYTPSAADVIIGSVNLTITTDDPAGPCNPATDFIVLVINQSPAASAGADAMICEGSSYTLTGTMGGGASSILWTSSGTGTFDDATLTGATYTPSALDIIIGSATLIITTDNPGGPCLATTDNMLLTINSSATVTAGVAATICEGDTYILSGAMGGSASSVTWISSGTGSFDDATLLAATYTHSAADALAGTVTFTITSDDPDGAGPCSAATDNVVLTIDPSATAAAGADASICEGSTYTLSGSFGGGASTITWITSGNGAFDDATLIGATYTPSSTDIIAGSVTLTITTDDPAGSCTAVTDNMVLTISPLPTITSANVTNITCNGDGDGIIDIIAANGTAPFTYSVDTGLTFQSGSSVGSLITGTYTIVVLDSAGCSVTGSTLTIIEPPAIVVLTSTVDANCGGSDGEVSVTATGGAGALNYLWNDPLASTTDTVKNLGAGSYSVVVTDANACTAIGAATVNDIGGATATAIWVKDADCNGSCDGAATVAVSGGTSPFTYSWNDPGTQVGDTATGLCAGDVIVTVTDNNACQSMDTVSIGEPLPLSIVLSPNDALQGTCNGWATVTVTGGTGPYAYLWSGGETTTSVTGLCPAPVSVQVTDGNQCVDSSSVTIGSYTGIDQTLEDLIGFDIFPNPTQGHLSIKYTFSEVIDFEIRVFNKLGALVFSKSLDLEKSGSYSLDLSGQANGIYYVQLITNQGTIARKVSLIR